MKLYIANGTYVGTQADAKKLDKDFEQVEVPTDKEGLIAYLNKYCGAEPIVVSSENIDKPLNLWELYT